MAKKIRRRKQQRHLGFGTLTSDVFGQLSGGQKTRVVNHLSRCARCRRDRELAKELIVGYHLRTLAAIKKARNS